MTAELLTVADVADLAQVDAKAVRRAKPPLDPPPAAAPPHAGRLEVRPGMGRDGSRP